MKLHAGLSWCSLLVLLQLLALQLTREAHGLDCYCNSIEEDCSGDDPCFECVTRVERELDTGNITVKLFCSPLFIICLQGNNLHSFCCLEDRCNGCPDLNVLNVTAAELTAAGFVFPPNCTYDASPVTSPEGSPDPPTSSKGMIPGVTPPTTPASSRPTPEWLIPVVMLAVVVVFVVFCAVVLCCYISRRRCWNDDVESIPTSVETSYRSYGMGVSMSGSSGALPGFPLLQAQTMSKMVKKKERIAKGGFGYVWRGEWDGKDYAVKVFPSKLYEHWQREGDIYKTCMLSHDNILRFLCMDSDDTTYGIDYILIFDYHHNGSLSDYLPENTLSQEEMLRFLVSIASGLGYLHRCILTSTTDKKPTLAHRDLKPSNILIKDDMTCCIGDLGLAVRESDFKVKKGAKEEVPDPLQGTKRYLAPEILGGTIESRSIGSYVMADMYAYSLVMWEVARRCEWIGDLHPHEIPYCNVVPSDPSVEDMRKVVVTEKVRPPLDAGWKKDQVLSEVSKLTAECWRENPESRLNIFRVKSNLRDIAEASGTKL